MMDIAPAALIFFGVFVALGIWGCWMAWRGMTAESPGFREGATNSGVQPRKGAA